MPKAAAASTAPAGTRMKVWTASPAESSHGTLSMELCPRRTQSRTGRRQSTGPRRSRAALNRRLVRRARTAVIGAQVTTVAYRLISESHAEPRANPKVLSEPMTAMMPCSRDQHHSTYNLVLYLSSWVAYNSPRHACANLSPWTAIQERHFQAGCCWQLERPLIP